MKSAILELPEVRSRVSPISVEGYRLLGEYNENRRRTELIRGIVIEKVSESPVHRALASRLYRWFLGRAPFGYSVWKEEPLTCRDSEPEPDLSITLGTETDFATAHPHTAALVVEIAVTNPDLDRENATLYAEAGVTEYWIVLAEQRKVEVYRRPELGQYRERLLFGESETIECPHLPGLRLNLAELFG